MKQYYIKLIDRIFTLIYIYEKDHENYEPYIESLTVELSNNVEFEEIRRVYFKLLAIKSKDTSHRLVRKTMFESINLVDSILSSWDLR